MPSISITEHDFEVVAKAANQALERGDSEAAQTLDKIARKINAVLAHHQSPVHFLYNTKNSRLRWQDVPSTLVEPREHGGNP